MIVGDLRHISAQFPETHALGKAFDFLRRPDIRDLPDGKITLDGERVFAIVQTYRTIAPEDPRFEYHRNYIDVQFIASGREIIGWAPADRMTVTEAYDPDKDIAFGTVPQKQWTPVLLGPGLAAVLWPEDAHAPRLAAAVTGSEVLKIVVKVAL